MIRKFISYPLSVIHYLVYGFLLSFFHPIQWICIHWIGPKAHKSAVDILNFLLVKSLLITGNRVKFTFESPLPKGKSLIFVANHQSVYDIPPFIWYLRDYNAKFVGKKELDNGVPSIAINLKNNGSVLIDRSNPRQALPALTKFGKYLQKNNYSAIIFPEGTRSRDGHPKPFKATGLKILLRNMPDALVVPVTINNSWKVLEYGTFPVGLGNKVSFYAHSPIAVNSADADTIISQTEETIKQSIVV